MKRLFTTLFIILLNNSYIVYSQMIIDVDKWKEYIEDLAAETDDEARLETLYTELSYLTEHPMDINKVDRKQLSALPFLSDEQIDNLLLHREQNGPFVSLYELKNIELMDFDTISLLFPFITLGDISVDKPGITVKNLLKQGKNELLIRYNQCLQQKKGYCSYPDSVLAKSPNKKYLGEPFYHSLRYSYSFDDRVIWGFVAEKDEGEPFWYRHHKGYDYYSAHLLLKDVGKVLKTLVIGDYKTSFGQGLVVSNDFTPGKSALVTQFERRNNGFRRHQSTNESDFFRGVAATLTYQHWQLSLLTSYRKRDAFLEEGLIRSFKTDGIHRLQRDMEKKRVVPMLTIGGQLRYEQQHLSLGFNLLSYSFGRYQVEPKSRPYNLYYFKGKKNINGSVDYLWKGRHLKFYGETALSRNGAVATLNALQLTPVSYCSLLLLHRYYDKRYQAFYGNAFGQNSNVQNEKGIYIGMQWTPLPGWKLSGYADFYQHPWLKYGVDAPSEGREYMVQTTYQPGERWTVLLRYRQKRNEKNTKVEENRSTEIKEYDSHSLKLQATYQPTAVWLLRTTLEGKLAGPSGSSPDKGGIIAQHITFQPSRSPLHLDGYIGYFHTDSYVTRIYSNEKSILYTFHSPSFYGEGCRLALSFRWDMMEKLSLFGKVGHTWYADRNEIGTDLEKIEGKNKTDVYLQLRWKF